METIATVPQASQSPHTTHDNLERIDYNRRALNQALEVERLMRERHQELRRRRHRRAKRLKRQLKVLREQHAKAAKPAPAVAPAAAE